MVIAFTLNHLVGSGITIGRAPRRICRLFCAPHNAGVDALVNFPDIAEPRVTLHENFPNFIHPQGLVTENVDFMHEEKNIKMRRTSIRGTGVYTCARLDMFNCSLLTSAVFNEESCIVVKFMNLIAICSQIQPRP